MEVVLAFACLLLLATLVSELAGRSVLSLSALFLVGGCLLGNTGFFAPRPTDPLLIYWTETALFFILYFDGMKLTVRQLSRPGHWPGRALFLGLPLTVVGVAILGRWLLDLGWGEAFLLGALLSPTDPVLTSSIIGSDALPEKLRHFLQVESGLNDGLALPLVFMLLHLLEAEPLSIEELLIQIAGGVLVGIGIAWGAVALARASAFKVSREYEPLFVSAAGLLILSATSLTGVNSFLAAYSGGITLTTLSERARPVFAPFANVLTEILKLSGILLFGTLLRPEYVPLTWMGVLFAVLVLCMPRPLALSLALIRSGIRAPEFWTAAWFGPRGFASMLYAIYVLLSGIPRATDVFFGAAVVIVASTVAHSSTDVPVSNWFRRASASGGRTPNQSASEA